jgi:hypothetical protein
MTHLPPRSDHRPVRRRDAPRADELLVRHPRSWR